MRQILPVILLRAVVVTALSLAATSFPVGAIAAAGDSTSITREVLPNGVTLLIHSSAISNVVGMEVISRVGTRYERLSQAGLAALTIQVALDGAGTRTGDEIRSWFEDRGSSLQFRAHPDYSEIGAAISTADFPEMASLFASVVQKATITPESFHKEQTAAIAQLDSPDQDEQAVAYNSLRTLLAASTAYGRPENGLLSTLPNLKREDAATFYHLMFSPANLIVSVSGNVSTSEATTVLRPLFSKIPAGAATGAPPGIRTEVEEPSSMVLAGRGDAAWIMVGFLTPGVLQPDYPAAAVLNAIIGGASSGMLPSLFRDRRGVYDSGSFLQPFGYQTHIVGYVRADPLLWDQKEQAMRPVIDAFQKDLLNIFETIRTRGVTAEQVQAARRFVYGDYLRSHEHNREYAGFLGWYEALGLGAAFDSQFAEQVQKVTPEQVNRLAASCFQPPQGATVVMFPRPRIED